jgi:hypothetical protein
MLAFGRVFVARKPCPARLLCTARRAITHMSSNRIRRTGEPSSTSIDVSLRRVRRRG